MSALLHMHVCNDTHRQNVMQIWNGSCDNMRTRRSKYEMIGKNEKNEENKWRHKREYTNNRYFKIIITLVFWCNVSKIGRIILKKIQVLLSVIITVAPYVRVMWLPDLIFKLNENESTFTSTLRISSLRTQILHNAHLFIMSIETKSKPSSNCSFCTLCLFLYAPTA